MSTFISPTTIPEIKVKESLPEVASSAAVELDNLRLHRQNGFTAVKELNDILIHMYRRAEPHIYPNDVLVMYQAVSNSCFIKEASPLRTTDELLTLTENIRERLKAIFSNPSQFENKTDEIVQLRTFCNELAKSALNYSQTTMMAPRNPFRR